MPQLLAPDCLQTPRRSPSLLRADGIGGTYRDGEVVPHVPPDDAVPEGVDLPPTFAGFFPVYEPPCSVEDTDQPKTREEEGDEGSYAALC